MTTNYQPDPETQQWLLDNGYRTVEDWARDSGYEHNGTEWVHTEHTIPEQAGEPADLEGELDAAIESDQLG